MSASVYRPFEDRESITLRWLFIFVLLSLLAHVLILGIILVITHFMPVPKIKPVTPPVHTVNLTLVPPPPPPAPKPKPLFMPTAPDAQAQHKLRPIVSANDTDLKTQSQKPRDPNSIMPDVNGQQHHSDLNNAPMVQGQQTPQVASTPPTPKVDKPQPPTPPQPTPQTSDQKPQPPSPTPKPSPPKPQVKPTPQVDPTTGLPLLPDINAPTLAPRNQAAQPLAPARSIEQQQTSINGAIGMAGANSPAAMATMLGKYKQQVYEAVGSHWYPKVDSAQQLIGVGEVRIRYTIHSDGSVETQVLDSGNSTMQILLGISQTSIRDAAPYDNFDKYPGIRQEIIKEQGGDGESYTDEFSFSIYGH
jgi:outer membrane biosynthesis protein TonB